MQVLLTASVLIQICDLSIQEYKNKVKIGSRRDALSLLLAATNDEDSPLSAEELVGAASIFLVAGTLLSIKSLIQALIPLRSPLRIFRTSWRNVRSSWRPLQK